MSSFRGAVNFKCLLCIHVTVDIIYECLYIGSMWVCVECIAAINLRLLHIVMKFCIIQKFFLVTGKF